MTVMTGKTADDLRAKIERDLIAKLESASAGSRELDSLIAVAVFERKCTDDDLIYAVAVRPYDECAQGTFWRVSRSGRSLHTAPHFTTSLDAALTLVPEGLYWIVGHGKTSPNELPFGAIISTPLPHCEERGAAGHNASAALALCIASLKAREADQLKEEA